MSKSSDKIVLFKQKSNGRIFAVGCIPLNAFWNDDEYEKEYKIINLRNIEAKQALLTACYYLSEDEEHRLTKTQYDLLSIACSKEEIHTRMLSKEECEEVIRDTHRFIHDVLEMNEFTITDDDGNNPKLYKWSEHGKIFVDQSLIK